MKRRFLLTLPLLLSGCPAPSSVNTNTTPIAVSAPVSAGKEFNYETASARAKEAAGLVAAQNSFGSQLLLRLEAKNSTHKNLLASPTSLWQALALTSSGAAGETKTQLETLLAMKNLQTDKIGPANRAFNTLLAEQKGASISVANSVWFADAFQPNPTFVKGAKANFGAGVELFPANDPEEGARRVNSWVSDNTRKEIPQIVTGDDVRGQSALLVNAVYFRGGWENTFDKRETKPAPFHLADGGSIEVPMMNGQRSHAYLSGDTFEGATLPYDNTSCALWVLLPKKGKSPADVVRELGESQAQTQHASDAVLLSLPRFDIEWREELSKDLAAMNAPLPFTAEADFSAMGQPTAGISAVLHVCKMRVDEEGTVAAAATAVAVAAGAAAPLAEPKKLVFDRPFVVALVEEMSGARLFQGTVYNPSAKS